MTELRAVPTDLRDARQPLSERVADARALGRFGPGPEAVSILLDALHDRPPPLLRDEILLALARRAPAAASGPLVALLERDEVPSPALMTALGAIGTPAAIAALAAALARPEVADLAERALLDVGPAAAAPLARAVSSAVALRAARLLGELGPVAAPSAVPALTRALASDAPALRATAAEALGKLGDRGGADVLLGLLADRSQAVVLAALSSLARVATPSQGGALAAYFERAPIERRAPALVALAAADPERALPELHRALVGSDAILRAAAVQTLEGERPHPSWTPLLRQLFDAELRETTASALARVAHGEGVPALLEAARRSPDAAQRAAAALAVALRRFTPELGADRVHDGHALLRSLPPGERRMLFCALARDRWVLAATITALAAKSAGRRATAANALGLLGAAEAGQALLAALAAEHDAEAARRMLEAASRLGVQVPLSLLSRLLVDAETAPEAMQVAAAGADPQAAPRALRVRLRRALSSREPPRVRAAAALALARLSDVASWPALQAALGDESPRVRLAAVRALASLGGVGATDALRSQTRVERDAVVRRAALQGLAHAGAPATAVAPSDLVLELHVLSQDGDGARPLLDVLLEDGRWLRLRALASGELIVADLAPGQADVRVLD